MRKFFSIFLGFLVVSSVFCTQGFAHASMMPIQSCCLEVEFHDMPTQSNSMLCEHCFQEQEFRSDEKIIITEPQFTFIMYKSSFVVKQSPQSVHYTSNYFPPWYYNNFFKIKSSIVLRS